MISIKNNQGRYSPINHSQEYSPSFLPGFCKFVCNTISDWLNIWFSQSEVVLHSNAAEYRKNLQNKTRIGRCVFIKLY